MEVPSEGQFLTIDKDLIVQVLNSTNSSSDLNESSIVLKVSHEDVSLLLTGDATTQNESNMIQKYNVSADVLKVGHHGASTSSSSNFLNKVQPTFSILSYGNNSYGHPNSTVVQRLESMGSDIYSTFDDGNIIIQSEADGSFSVTGGTVLKVS